MFTLLTPKTAPKRAAKHVSTIVVRTFFIGVFCGGLWMPSAFATEDLEALGKDDGGLVKDEKGLVNGEVSIQSTTAVEQLVDILQSFTSLEGRFTQTLEAKNGQLLQTTEGSFAIQRPGMYLWESAEPYPQTIVGNGETIWVYDPDLEQVTLTPQASMPLNPAMLLSGGIDNLSERFVVNKSVAEASKQQVFKLTPLNTANAPFLAIELTFKGSDITQAALTDRLSQRTVMTFSDLTANAIMDKSRFNFIVPKGTDVLANE